jgi:hypothetical protein
MSEEQQVCIRCGEAPSVDEIGLCGHCHWAVRSEVEHGLDRFAAYLGRWAAFRAWESVTGGGGGGGGAATIADGADVAQGATTDASSANTVVGLLKAIKAFLAGTLTVGDGGGSLTVDAPVGTPVWVRLSDGAAAYVGQKVAASSIPIVIASDQSSVPTTEARLPTALVGGRLDVNIGAASTTVGVNPSSETAGVGVGAAADAESSGNGSAIAILKRIRTLLGGTLIVSILNATLRGASTGAPATTDTALVVGVRDDVDIRDRTARLLGHVNVDAAVAAPVWVRLSDGAASFVGQKAMAASIPVVLASDQASIPVAATLAAASDGTKAEDAASVSGDRGIFNLGIRRDTLGTTADTSADGDYTAFSADHVGRQYVRETPPDNAGTTISGANAGVTLTLAAPAAGLRHYITRIVIKNINPTAAAIAGSAVTLAYTSTNLPGSLAWTAGNALAAGAEKVVEDATFPGGLKSSAAATATTIVAPAIGAGGLCRITAYYFIAP